MTENVPTPARRVDRGAVVTYVLAVLWLFGIGSVLALYFGRLSVRRMKSRPELRGRPVAWAGIALAILGAILAGLWLSLWVGLSLAA